MLLLNEAGDIDAFNNVNNGKRKKIVRKSNQIRNQSKIYL